MIISILIIEVTFDMFDLEMWKGQVFFLVPSLDYFRFYQSKLATKSHTVAQHLHVDNEVTGSIQARPAIYFSHLSEMCIIWECYMNNNEWMWLWMNEYEYFPKQIKIDRAKHIVIFRGQEFHHDIENSQTLEK